jgi:hypothetical protein
MLLAYLASIPFKKGCLWRLDDRGELVLSAKEHAQASALAVSRALPHVLVARAKLVL